jgi:hypothetical protein
MALTPDAFSCLAAEVPAKPAPIMMTSVSVMVPALAEKALAEAIMPVMTARRSRGLTATP